MYRLRRVQQFDGGSEQNVVSSTQRLRVIGSISVQWIRVLEVFVLHPPHRVLQQLDGRHRRKEFRGAMASDQCDGSGSDNPIMEDMNLFM